MKNKKMYLFGITLIIFIFNNLLISSLLFLLNISISYINVILSFLLTILIYILIMKKENYHFKEQLISISLFIIIIITSIFISGQIYDTTYDGNTYHKTAVGQLKSGWNPVYETIEEFNDNDNNELKLTNNFDIWNDHYAKGYWIYAANIYSLTNNIETGKSIYLITIIGSILICYSYLNLKFKKSISLIISLLLSLNPITLCQFSTFYNDGLLGNFLILMIFSLTLILENKNELKKYHYLLYLLTLIILINIKFTGFAYAGIYSLCYYLYILFNKSHRKIHLKNITIIGVIGVIIGVFLIGLSTYPKNIKTNNHPFYPLYGENKVDIMSENTPNILLNKNRFEKFFISNFSKTYNDLGINITDYKLKIPFTISLEELKYFIGPDIRLGGFGVLFSGILLLSIILLIYSIFKQKSNILKNIKYLIPIFASLILIIILEDTWWARYLPQFYLLPIISLIIFNDIELKKKTKMLINVSFTIILIINSLLILAPRTLDILMQKIKIEESFKELNIKENTVVFIETDEFTGSIYNIKDRYNNIQVTKNLDNKENYTKYELMGPRINLSVYVKKD